MLDWLEGLGHWGFVYVSYGLVLLAIGVDQIGQLLRRQSLTRQLQQQRLRRRLRKGV